MDIDSVDQRPGDPLSIPGDLFRRAMASSARVAGVATGTGIHRRHQLKSRGKFTSSLESRELYHSALERFAQGFQCVPRKFRKLVEKQNAQMRQREFARFQGASA